MSPAVVKAFGILKGAAAKVNARHGLGKLLRSKDSCSTGGAQKKDVVYCLLIQIRPENIRSHSAGCR